jgi:Ni,Fe-hydrogenase III large subunit
MQSRGKRFSNGEGDVCQRAALRFEDFVQSRAIGKQAASQWRNYSRYRRLDPDVPSHKKARARFVAKST